MSFAAPYGVNASVNASVNAGADADEVQGKKRFLVGVGLSVVLHVMLMFAYRGHGPALPAFEPERSAPIAVRILPPAPPPPAPRTEPRTEPLPKPPAAPASPRSARKTTSKPVIAVPSTPQQEGASDSFSVQQAEKPASNETPETPQFDMNAAMQTARQLANQTKLGREGNANAQFPDPPLETETKAARAISRAKRRNCKDGIPGGLLAPLFLMMDKKDHGCKW